MEEIAFATDFQNVGSCPIDSKARKLDKVGFHDGAQAVMELQVAGGKIAAPTEPLGGPTPATPAVTLTSAPMPLRLEGPPCNLMVRERGGTGMTLAVEVGQRGILRDDQQVEGKPSLSRSPIGEATTDPGHWITAPRRGPRRR